MANLQIQAVITAKDEASKVVKGFSKSIGDAEAGSKLLAGTLVGVAAGAVAFGVKSVQAYNASVEAGTKLATNLLAVKGNTQANVDSLNKFASALQGVGVIEDDVIKAGMSQLATFALQGKTIETLTPKIADMAVQLYGHNVQAEQMANLNNLVGKVMTGNIGALSKYGVTLSEVQKEQLKNANEEERAVLLTQVLSQNYGDLNKALAQTPEGQITKLKNNFGDLMEVVGELAINAVMPLINNINEFVSSVMDDDPLGYLQMKFQQLQPYIGAVAGAIMIGLVPAIWALAAGVWATLSPLIPFIAVGAALGLMVQKLIEYFGGWDQVMLKLQPTINALKAVGSFLWAQLLDLWDVIQTNLVPALQRLWQQVEPILLPVLKVLGAIIGIVIVGAILVLIGVIKAIVYAISIWVDMVSQGVENLKGLWAILEKTWYIQRVKENFQQFVSVLKEVWNWVVKVAGKISELGDKAVGGIQGIFGGGRAAGGPVSAGTTYMVGERGPELFTPSTSGNITPNGGGGIVINIQNVNARNEQEARNSVDMLARLLETARLGV